MKIETLADPNATIHISLLRERKLYQQYREGEAVVRLGELEGGGLVLTFDPPQSMIKDPHWRLERWFETDGLDMRLSAVLDGKKEEGRQGCGDYVGAVLMRYPGEFTMAMIWGADALSRAWSKGWEKRLRDCQAVLHPVIGSSFQECSLDHPDIIHALLEAEYTGSPQFEAWANSAARTIRQAIANEKVNQKVVPKNERHPFPYLEHISLDLLYDQVLSRADFFGKEINKILEKYMPDASLPQNWLNWYFNAIFSGVVVICPEVLDDQDGELTGRQIIASLRSSADIFNHTGNIDSLNLAVETSLVNTNASVDRMIEELRASGLSDEEREKHLIDKAGTLFAVYPIDDMSFGIPNLARLRYRLESTTTPHVKVTPVRTSMNSPPVLSIITDGMLFHEHKEGSVRTNTNVEESYSKALNAVYQNGVTGAGKIFDQRKLISDDRGLIMLEVR